MTRAMRRLTGMIMAAGVMSSCSGDFDLNGCQKDSCPKSGEYTCSGNVAGFCAEYEGDPCIYRYLQNPRDCSKYGARCVAGHCLTQEPCSPDTAGFCRDGHLYLCYSGYVEGPSADCANLERTCHEHTDTNGIRSADCG